MKIDFNQQQQIIDHVSEPIATLVVNAGAGTGKTRTLVSTLIRMVEDGLCEFSQIVAITFTRKAAEEIKQRLNEATGGKYLAEIETAYIGTIDAFCSRLLRENFLYSGVGSSFKVIQPAKQESILINLLNNILAGSPREAVDLAFNIELQEIKSLIIDNYLQLRSSGYNLEQLTGSQSQNYDQFVTDLREHFKEHYIEPLLGMMADHTDLSSIREHIEHNYLDREERSQLLHIKNFAVEGAEKDHLKSITAILRKKLDQLIKLTIDLPEHQHNSAEIFKLIAMLEQKYTQYKQAHKQLDYQDLPAMLIAMLQKHPHLQQKYRRKFKKIFVDEFQDTSNQQEEIIRLLYNANLFIVGDWKQSIYGFRNAEPEIFNKYLKDSSNRVIDLSYNYRSSQQVLDLVNSISASIFEKAVPLIPGRTDDHSGEVKVLFYRTGEELGKVNKAQKRYLEADIIARKILSLKDRGSTVILFRKKSPMALYDEVLNSYGIDTSLVSGNDYFLRQEVQVIIDYLKVINDPFDDVSLINCLRSALFALRDQSLLILTAKKDDQKISSFFETLQYIADLELMPAEKEKIYIFLKRLEKYRKLKNIIPLPSFIEMIIEEAEYRLYAVSDRQGEYILSIINKLIELSQDFTYKEFLDYVQLVQLKGDDQTVEVGEDEASVQLMTIHKAKGLEFDTVFLADLEIKNQIKLDTLPLEKQLIENSIKPEIITRDIAGDRQVNLLQEVVKFLKKEKEIDEAKRLLYVALTRAADNLFVMVEQKESKNSLKPFAMYGDHSLNWQLWFNYLRDQGELAAYSEEITISEIPRKRARQQHQQKDLKALLAARESIRTIEELRTKDFFREMTVNQAAKLLADEQGFLKENYWGEQLDWDENTRKGEIIHERLNQLPQFEKNCIEQLIAQKDGYQNIYQGIINSGLLEQIQQGSSIYRELPFIMKKNDLTLRGRIDLLIIAPDQTIQVVDYKTGASRPEYSYQLAIYHEALRQVYEQAAVTLKLLYLPTGQIEEVLPVNGIIEQISQKLTGKDLYK